MRPSRVFLLATVLIAAVQPVGCQRSETPGAGQSAAESSAPPPPLAILDTPREGATVPNKSWGTGWALDRSGIFQVTATAENGAVAPAQVGRPFPGVKETYPDFPDADKAGFIFGVPDLPSGPHTLTVEVVARNGARLRLSRRFTVK